MAEMTHKQIVNRQLDIAEELERLSGKDELDERDETYWHELVEEHSTLDRERKNLERQQHLEEVRKSEVFRQVKNPRARLAGSEPDDPETSPSGEQHTRNGHTFGDPYDLSEIRSGLSPEQRGSELRARALTAIEKMPVAEDRRREVMTQMIERWDNKHGAIADLALATSTETYVRAFGKLVQNQANMAALDPDEQQAVQRAMSLTDAEGGFLVPFQLDPSVINTADGSFNQVRQISRQVVATGDVWNGVSSAGVTSRWAGEATESQDDAPALAQPTVPIHKLDIFVPISIEALMDAQNVASEVGQMIAFEKDRRESVAFVSGTGAGQPTGIVSELDGGASIVLTDAATTFGVVDVYALDGALPTRYRMGASWLANRLTYNDVRQFDTQGGSSLWVQLSQDVPPQLLGRNAYESEEMDTGTVAGRQILIFGDFSNYVIADRIGTTVEFVPHLFGANGRPTGQRGWYAYARVGAGSVNDGAFRMLQVDA